MSQVRRIVNNDLRVIVCFEFDHRASCEEIDGFKRCMTECPHVLQTLELSGTFDFMIEASVPDMAAYHERLNSLAGILSKLVAKYEANFVCSRYVRIEESDEHSIWVPCEDGQRRLDIRAIDKIAAEGDYMRIHCGSQSWLVHTTLKQLIAKLDMDQFVHLHRSRVVRFTFIDRLVHRRDRWIARLNDGSEQSVSKSHVGTVLRRLRSLSATEEGHSSKQRELDENLITVNET